MKNYRIFQIGSLILLSLALNACFGDLDTEPLDDESITSASVFDNETAYKQFLAKLYGGLTLTGQRGEYGQPEISASDEGTTSFMRTYWSAQEVTTDEAINAWGDPGLVEFHSQTWSDNNLYIKLMYQRIFINIAYCNEYIREVSERVEGLSSPLRDEVTTYLAEARYLRALYYYFAMDLWGNVPFVTESDDTGAYLPEQIARTDLFLYIESELEAILPALVDARQNEYARADKAAAWMLLAKMYLNAEVYLGEGNERFSDCIAQCNNIITSGAYTLHTQYSHLFLADNDRLRNEIIFPIAEDGDNTRNYGGVTYIIHAAVGGSQDADKDFGIGSGGWFGNRPTTTFVETFEDPSGETDHRAMFYTDGQTLEIENPTVFTEGYLCEKFKNITSAGIKGKNDIFVDTDFPLFRLADVYLMYAEAVKRGGTGGNEATALDYINALRTRAYGNASGHISLADLTLDFILDERGRELYWEGHRRTDLIRYGRYSDGDYLWDWKGNVKDGKVMPAHLDIFPIPSSDLGLNTNLKQNKDY
ncbi:RagB/SusD family nutrient uptake outer membrane protein [Marinoscillum sp.]|uniref:RagB/SusD family nutrient uptake outer membrane protein n=1 Tax=Marinoscillum sp. TaxID=2024838 RepID=UPI003BA9647A